MCDSTQGSFCPTPMVICKSMWIQWLFLKKLILKVSDPKMTFDPTSVVVTCVTLPKDHCIQVPWKYVKICGYNDFFSKILTKWSMTQMTPRWPLTPLLLRSHVQLKDYCVQLPQKYIKACGYSDLLSKTLTNGQWPLDDLWPHFCWDLQTTILVSKKKRCNLLGVGAEKIVMTMTFLE